MKSKRFDPISVDSIDVVDDWVMGNNRPLLSPDGDCNWRVINQPVHGETEFLLDDVETFVSGTSRF
ncbi:hypothetical protein KSP40_PGU015936 [Platanthera guangdongensis]|uniref:Uncharacterized protein n=1 Tax=Platanthera guangdongensis TaxID=2320717 RepID=A0ABR2M398_9ASPA